MLAFEATPENLRPGPAPHSHRRDGSRTAPRIVRSAGHPVRSARVEAHPRLLVYAGAPHGITDTHKDRLSGDLLEFITT
jgi:hypothetical protein